ncbi:hypothetical protein MITS9508_00538 [Synechococcus sp. MIT S9508]|nr:hypothetical protein MITS9508_00538 [Synechococcus sp. MIT S9508]
MILKAGALRLRWDLPVGYRALFAIGSQQLLGEG